MIDLAKEIWQTMRTNKLRTLLTGISVAWGIFMLILLLAISNGLINTSRSFMENNDPYRISIWDGRTSKPYMGFKEGRKISLKEKYIQDLKKDRINNVVDVTANISLSLRVSTNKDYLTGGYISGVYPSTFTGLYKFVQGRALNQSDLSQKRKVAVIQDKAAKLLFDNPDKAVGEIIKIGDLGFTVVGVFQNEHGSDEVFIPYSTAYALGGYKDNLDRIDVHMQDISTEQESSEIADKAKASIAKSAKFAPDDNSAIWMFDRFSNYLTNMKATSILNTTMWIIGLLTLITGIVGVSNIMFVSVRERTHEIGIRRAIGAKPHNLIIQIVLESIALTTIFGYIGIVMGTIGVEIFSYYMRDSRFFMNPSVDLNIAIQVTIALIIAGALAGLFPALKAIKIKPVEALRDE